MKGVSQRLTISIEYVLRAGGSVREIPLNSAGSATGGCGHMWAGAVYDVGYDHTSVGDRVMRPNRAPKA